MASEQVSPVVRLFPLLLVHGVAALVCFGFFTVVPIGACLVLMAIGNDAGGPMFFPMFVMGTILMAVMITGLLGSVALVSDLIRRHRQLPVWIPPLIVFFIATCACWLFFDKINLVATFIFGAIAALAFVIHWTAISASRYLLRLIFGNR